MFEKGTDIWKNSIRIMHERLESSRISANKRFNSLLVRWKEFEKSTRGGIDDVTVLLNQLYFLHVANYLYSIRKLQSAGKDVTPATISNDFAGNLFELCRGGEPFKIFSDLSEFLWDDGTEETRSIMDCFVDEAIIQATMERMNQGGDMLSSTYQTLFSSNKKHSTGEFYTPLDLCNLMVEKLASRHPGAVVLDPSCGVGTFLVSWIEHTVHDKNIQDPVAGPEFRMHGWDINPVAIIGARVNTWLGFPEGMVQFDDIVQNIKLKNALEDLDEFDSLEADIMIGNPPWVTLKDFASKEVKTRVSQIAKQLGISPGGHGTPQLELATVIFTKCFQDHLKVGGHIFFVLTSSVLNGKHCGKFRKFTGMSEMEVWLFTGDDLFPKPFICLLGKKNSTGDVYFTRENAIPATMYQVQREKNQGTGESWHFTRNEGFELQPVNLVGKLETMPSSRRQNLDQPMERLIDTREASRLLPTTRDSHYSHSCYNGATIFPQALLFVKILDAWEERGIKMVRIMPAPWLNMKKPWNFFPYSDAIVEARYIFRLVKGSELYTFGNLDPQRVFLPIIKGGDSFQADQNIFSQDDKNGKPLQAALHFRKLNAIFQDVYNGSHRITNLWDRINFDNELTNQAMLSKWKVIFPDCGSIMAAAVIPQDIIVEHALHYVGIEDEMEAYFLCGVLNAPCIQDDIMLRKAERHIGQIVMDYRIPSFSPSNSEHLAITHLSKALEEKARSIVESWIHEQFDAARGKFQCPASLKFMEPEKIQAHEHKCKKYHRMKEALQEGAKFLKVEGNRDEIRFQPSRRKIDKLLHADDSFLKHLKDLDEKVKLLLTSPSRR